MKILKVTLYVADHEEYGFEDLKCELDNLDSFQVEAFLEEEASIDHDAFEGSTFNSVNASREDVDTAFKLLY